MTNGTKRGWGVSDTHRPLFTPEKDPAPIVQETGWAPGLVWTGAENLSPTGIRSPDRPARSQSLYRLGHPAHFCTRSMLQRINEEIHKFVSFLLFYGLHSMYQNHGCQSYKPLWYFILLSLFLLSFFLCLDLCWPTYGKCRGYYCPW
jgi:hypothetical protein